MQCTCGGSERVHKVGDRNCLREKVLIKPRPFPKFEDKWILEHDEVVTGTTLREQRGYHQHRGGSWSRPKDHSSENSIEA